ncbi:MAG: cytochrome c-type biogenesis CcmF C-terminal domain-containing protein [Actinomycetota bacterium]|nr:cytochrome c-type biogenesis CcmF C-terminal domain-containing protein [Actinomycetota bacterium]|tara:strand:+ start:989 stop:2875 length:1887 start_codon:yes stop_codon:yes gene_type:complete
MISNIGIIVTWISFLNLIFLFFSKSNFQTQRLVRINLFFHFILFCLLEIGLFIDDFSISYIANYSASTTPPIYKFASLWGSLDGSILLWNFVLSIYFLIYIKYFHKKDFFVDVKIFSSILIFFVGYTIFSSSPFSGCIELSSIGCANSTLLPFNNLLTSEFGRGPNPLLQNHPLMAIHPPILYAGYIGLVMPFVISTSHLIRNETNNDWIKMAEKATFFPWIFLTAGISLGAAWSYEVLGWGGYWAWDPVENVSFIPWLLATAFLHSAKTQIRESTLINWNYSLSCLMFLSTIFGTFITRSGVLISVHAFSNGNIGTYLLIGLSVFTGLYLIVGARNIKYFSSAKKLSNWFGRSGFFIANNIILFSATIVVFVGTVYPIFYETLYDRQLTIGRSFYDTLVGPLLLVLLLLIVFSVKLPNKNLNFSEWIKTNQMEINITLIFSIGISLYYEASYKFIFTIFASTILVVTLSKNLISYIRKGKISGSYWAGQIAHIGIGIFAIGLVLNVTQSYSKEIITSSGSNIEFAGNNYLINQPYQESKDEKDVINLPISKNNKVKNASLNIFKNSNQQAISSPAIFRNIESDTYITIKVIDDEYFKLIIRKNYGIFIIWLGLALTIFSIYPRIKNE